MVYNIIRSVMTSIKQLIAEALFDEATRKVARGTGGDGEGLNGARFSCSLTIEEK
jgi:hypothetical protein